MSKIRVYEYAKKHNISSKEIITKLKEMNIEVSNHMATIEDAEVKKLDETFSKKDNKATQQKPENSQTGQQPQRSTNSRPTQAQRQNQRPAQSTQRPQVQTKTPKAFEEAADKNAAPSKVKVVSPPKRSKARSKTRNLNRKKIRSSTMLIKLRLNLIIIIIKIEIIIIKIRKSLIRQFNKPSQPRRKERRSSQRKILLVNH
jgi:translation initiation factor IF-2